MKPAIVSDQTLIMLMDLVGQLQRQIIVLRHVLVHKGTITSEELELLTQKADTEIKPLRDQLLEAIETARIQALQDLELGDETQRQ